MKSSWKEIYNFLCQLEKKFYWKDGEISQQHFKNAVFTPPERPDLFKSAYIKPSLMDDVMKAREYLVDYHDYLYEIHWNLLFEDVYQTAIYLKDCRHSSHIWYEDNRHFFRGQRNDQWKVIPTIFRGAEQDTLIEQRFLSLSHYVRGLREKLPSLTENQAVAIVQHYSTELDLRTWLVDFTWDPFIALFFASSDGKEGDEGVIYQISQIEWDRLSAQGSNIFGPIEIIEVPTVYRINTQKALFIRSLHPELFDKFSPYSIRFKQHKSLIFEDMSHDPPITADFLHNEKDNFIETLLKIKPIIKKEILKSAPPPLAVRSLEVRDFFKILISWCVQENYSFETKMWKVFAVICDIYCRMQKLGAESAHSLFNAIDHINSHYDRLIEMSLPSIVEEVTLSNLNHTIKPIEKLNVILDDVKNEIQNNKDYFKIFNTDDSIFY